MGSAYSFTVLLANATEEDVATAVDSLGAAFKPFATAVVHNGLSGEDLADEDADLQVGAFIDSSSGHYAFISIISHIANFRRRGLVSGYSDVDT